MKYVSIDQFLTKEEISRAITLYLNLEGTGKFAQEVDEEIITPNIERINKALGQKNNPRFLAYAVEYTLMRREEKK